MTSPGRRLEGLNRLQVNQVFRTAFKASRPAGGGAKPTLCLAMRSARLHMLDGLGRSLARTAFRCGLCAVAAVVVVAGYGGASLVGQSGTTGGEWRYHGGDPGSTKYSPLDQINRDNVKSLRFAWRWKTENFGPAPDYNFQVTPLMASGVLYTTAGWRRDVAAIDPATGETLWMFRHDEGRRGQTAPVRPAAGRGLAYWSDGTNERILYITRGYHLIQLDAKTGHLVPTFGKGGIADLYESLDQPRP